MEKLEPSLGATYIGEMRGCLFKHDTNECIAVRLYLLRDDIALVVMRISPC